MDIFVLSPPRLVSQAVEQFLSEKHILEAQTSPREEGEVEEDPLVGSGNDLVEETGASNEDASPMAVQGEKSGGEQESGEGGEGGKEEGKEEEAVEEDGSMDEGSGQKVSEEQSSNEQLPPYFSEVRDTACPHTQAAVQHDGAMCCHSLPQLSPTAALGYYAHLSLSNGEQVEDSITVKIIVEELK